MMRRQGRGGGGGGGVVVGEVEDNDKGAPHGQERTTTTPLLPLELAELASALEPAIPFVFGAERGHG